MKTRFRYFSCTLLMLTCLWTQQLLAGDLFTSADLVDSVNFSQLDLSNSIPIVFGKGDLKIAVFADPQDRHARRFEEEIEKMGDATLYVFISPILGDKSVKLANTIWCSPDRKSSWAGRFASSPDSIGGSCTNPDAISKNMGYAARFPSKASPILVFQNNLVHFGFADREFVKATSSIKYLAAKAKADAEARERNERYKRACDSYYPGRVGRIEGDGLLSTKDGFIVRYVNKDRKMVTIEGTTGGNSLKNGQMLELSCSSLQERER